MIIAEIGSNHRGSIELAEKYVDVLLKSPVDSITFQIREPEFYFGTCASLKLSYEELNSLQERVKSGNKNFGLALCDLRDGVYPPPDFIKVLSKDLDDLQFLRNLTKKFSDVEIHLSTGMGDINTIEAALKIVRQCTRQEKVKIIHTCVSNTAADANLKAILTLKEKFGNIVSYGSHSSNLNVIYASCAYEPADYYFYVKHSGEPWTAESKHPDDLHAVPIEQVDTLCNNIKEILCSLGSGKKEKNKNKIKGQT